MADKPKPTYRVKVWKEEQAVCLQVLEMPEELRGVGEIYKTKKNWGIYSSDTPALIVDSKQLCLRGSRDHQDWCVISAPSVDNNAHRDAIYDDIKEAFQEFADSSSPKGGGEAKNVQDAIELVLMSIQEVVKGKMEGAEALKLLKAAYKELFSWYDRASPRFEDGKIWEW